MNFLAIPFLAEVFYPMQSAVPGLSNFVYGFFKDAEPYRMALDISFGTIGYPLILSRAFQEVKNNLFSQDCCITFSYYNCSDSIGSFTEFSPILYQRRRDMS